MLIRKHPIVLEVNTRIWLDELSVELGHPATLDDIPDDALDSLLAVPFDAVWLLGVWQTGPLARRISKADPALRAEAERLYGVVGDNDITGSCFSIRAYRVHSSYGGNEALARFRKRLRHRGVALLLDFVPNHVAPDHDWVATHPTHFFSRALHPEWPEDWFITVPTPDGELTLAAGRSEGGAPWRDTLQLDWSEPSVAEAMLEVLEGIATQCDGVRCDMATLELPEVFARTWGRPMAPFWNRAIQRVRKKHPDFLFLAEVYSGHEQRLQELGFDYTYDKTLYDRLRDRDVFGLARHLESSRELAAKSAVFLENHDEGRARAAFGREFERAASIFVLTRPGLRLLHQGQLQGKELPISVHFRRGPAEETDFSLLGYFAKLLPLLADDAFHEGQYVLLETRPAWDGNGTHRSVFAHLWQLGSKAFVVIVNVAPANSQARVRLDALSADAKLAFFDPLQGERFERDASEVAANGLFVDLAPGHYHLLESLSELRYRD